MGVLPIFEAMPRSHTSYQVPSTMTPTVSIVPSSDVKVAPGAPPTRVAALVRPEDESCPFGVTGTMLQYFRHTYNYVMQPCWFSLDSQGGRKRKNLYRTFREYIYTWRVMNRL